MNVTIQKPETTTRNGSQLSKALNDLLPIGGFALPNIFDWFQLRRGILPTARLNMKQNVRLVFVGLSVLSMALLSACGGGGGGGSAASQPVTGTAEGRWSGKTNTGKNLTTIVLDTGEYWGFYSSNGIVPGYTNDTGGGWVYGTSTSVGGSFTSTDAIDSTTGPATISGSYRTRQSLNGIVTYPYVSVAIGSPPETVSFTSHYEASYSQNPSVATLAGTYNTGNGDLTISSSGSISGLLYTTSYGSGCQASGTITPHSSGNLYDVSMSLAFNIPSGGSSACPDSAAVYKGILFPGLPSTPTWNYGKTITIITRPNSVGLYWISGQQF